MAADQDSAADEVRDKERAERPLVTWETGDKPLDIEGVRAIAEKHPEALPWWLASELVPLCDYALALERERAG